MHSAATLIELIKNGSITLDHCGHALVRSDQQLLSELVEALENHLDCYKTLSAKHGNLGMDILFGAADEEFATIGNYVTTIFGNMTVFCQACGARMRIALKGPAALGLSSFKHNEPPSFERCRYAQEAPQQSVSIQVPTGTLLFANFFPQAQDAPDAEKHSQKYDLCSLAGRNAVAQHLAQQGYGCAHTGNTTVHLYRHVSRDEIIVTEDDCARLKDEVVEDLRDRLAERGGDQSLRNRLRQVEEKLELLQKDYCYLGAISCSVWRWMCADLQTLEAAGFKKEKGRDYVQVEVTPGSWEIVNHFTCEDTEAFPLARLRRIAAQGETSP